MTFCKLREIALHLLPLKHPRGVQQMLEMQNPSG